MRIPCPRAGPGGEPRRWWPAGARRPHRWWPAGAAPPGEAVTTTETATQTDGHTTDYTDDFTEFHTIVTSPPTYLDKNLDDCIHLPNVTGAYAPPDDEITAPDYSFENEDDFERAAVPDAQKEEDPPCFTPPRNLPITSSDKNLDDCIHLPNVTGAYEPPYDETTALTDYSSESEDDFESVAAVPDARKEEDPLWDATFVKRKDDQVVRGGMIDIVEGKDSGERYYILKYEDGEVEQIQEDYIEEDMIDWSTKRRRAHAPPELDEG